MRDFSDDASRFIKSMNVPDDVKAALLKQVTNKLSDLGSEKEFFDKINYQFQEKYKTPADMIKAMFRLAHFEIFTMIKSAIRDREEGGASDELYLTSLLMTITLLMEEQVKGLGPILNTLQAELIEYVTKNPDLFTEAKSRFENMIRDNKDAAERFESRGL